MKYFFGGYKGDRKIDPEEVVTLMKSNVLDVSFYAGRLQKVAL